MLCYYASNQSINQSASLLQTPLLILLSSEINFKTNQLFQTKEKEKNNKFACIDSLSVSVQQTKTQKWKKENEMIKIVVVQLQIIREGIKRTDQVVKSLRNWARAPARMADKRGRFQGSNKKDGVVAVIVDVVAPLPAPALTSSISDSEWLCFLSDDFCWLLNMSNSI